MLAKLFSVALAFALLTSTVLTAAHAQTYTYDNRGQLTQIVYPNGARVNYTYDAAGNRTVQTISTAGDKAPNAGAIAPSSLAHIA